MSDSAQVRFRVSTVGEAWLDQNVPCTQACPVLTNAGRYVSAIAQGDDELAYLTARLPNPFPSICGRVCAAPCEIACRRGVIDEPIAIRALKRFACERGGVESGHGDALWRRAVESAPPREERVAVIGAGPAGLACAHDLAAYGYRPVVFEGQDRPGGMMVLGIPTYRLRRDVLEAEVRAILDLGVELRTGLQLGRDFSLSSLRDDGFAAVFVGVGAMRSRDLQIPGVELDGVLRAVDFLINANLGYRVELGERVVVIGGGNVALDAARTALRDLSAPAGGGRPAETGGSTETVDAAATATLDVARVAKRLGARDVQVVSLESRAEMPAHEFEIQEAEIEGIRFLPRRGPKRIVGDGHVQGLETLAVTSVFAPDGRFDPQFRTGSESVIECDSVILAVGQAPDLSWLRPEDGVDTGPRGTIGVDPASLATSAPGIYAGGDVAFGPRNLIDAIGDGRRAAASIHRLIAGPAPLVSSPPLRRPIPLRVVNRPILGYDAVPRVPVPAAATERRVGVAEIELGFTEEQARREAARCLQCFLNIWLDVDLCILCGGCVDICPEDCIRIVPVEDVEAMPAAAASALILQEDRCIRCGLCIERCPTDALSMVQWNEVSTELRPAEPSVA